MKCNKDKKLDEYRVKGIGYQRNCKECMKEYDKKHYLKNKENYGLRKKELSDKRYTAIKEEIWKLKNNPCTDCNNKFPPVCMDFDHIKNKTRNISDMLNAACSFDIIKKEIEKCELVCANCHRIRTHNRQQSVAQW